MQPPSQFRYYCVSFTSSLWIGYAYWWPDHSSAAGQMYDSVAPLISPAWTEPKKHLTLVFSLSVKFSPYNSLSLVSLCLFLAFLSPTNHFAPTPISHFPPLFVSSILSLIHSASICLWVSVSISIYVSLFGINLTSLSWSPNFIFFPSPPPPHYFSVHKIKLPHMRHGRDGRGGSERGKGKKMTKDRCMKQQWAERMSV